MSAEWVRAKKEVAERAAGLCEAAGPGCLYRGAHAHHVRRRSQGGKDTADNLLWVCAQCHRYIHEHPAWAEKRNYLRRTQA